MGAVHQELMCCALGLLRKCTHGNTLQGRGGMYLQSLIAGVVAVLEALTLKHFIPCCIAIDNIAPRSLLVWPVLRSK